MPDQHMPGAELHLLDDAPMTGDGGARVIWHITWDKNATAQAPSDLVPFDNLVGYFTSSGSGAAPHLIWDPFTGRIAQLFSATSRSKSVINAPGGVETNRKGNVCIQIETLFFPYCRVNGQVYATVADTPCIGLDRIMAWLRSWGVPDVWPMGPPDWNSHRDAHVWDTRSGHYGHSQVPENDHTDPGPMPALFALQEDDMTPDQIAGAPLPYWGTDGKISGTATLGDYFGGLDLAARATKATLAAIQATQAAQTATLKLLLDQNASVDTDAVLAAIHAISQDAAAAVQQALAAGVTVHVDVPTTPKGN